MVEKSMQELIYKKTAEVRTKLLVLIKAKFQNNMSDKWNILKTN